MSKLFFQTLSKYCQFLNISMKNVTMANYLCICIIYNGTAHFTFEIHSICKKKPQTPNENSEFIIFIAFHCCISHNHYLKYEHHFLPYNKLDDQHNTTKVTKPIRSLLLQKETGGNSQSGCRQNSEVQISANNSQTR